LSTAFPNLVRLNDDAFDGCTNLTSVDFTNIQSLGAYTFRNTALTGIINIPNLTEIRTDGGIFAYAGGPFKNTTITELNTPNLTKIIGCSDSRGSVVQDCGFPPTL
jgi:hypothetical protein